VNAALAAIAALLGLTLIKATPLIYAALGGVLSERSGVVNIGLEGILIAGAFTSVAVSGATGNPVLGALAGIIAGMLLAAILAFAATRLAVDQIVAGTGLNIAALAAAAFGLVLVCPADSPKIVTLLGSPPNVSTLSRTHSRARTRSR
jgi:general nucleoside transport system permease protein